MLTARFRLLPLLLAVVAGVSLAASALASTIILDTSSGTGLQTANGGTLTLTRANTYPGATTINAGTLSLTGSTGLVKTGTGTLTLTGSNIFTGATTIDSGTLNLSSIIFTNGNGAVNGTLIGDGVTLNTALVEGVVNYPAGANTVMARLGAPCDFGKFRNDRFSFNDPVFLGTLIIGSNRPMATPPAALTTFASDGAAPAALITAADGTIYGVTNGGGPDNTGQVVRVEVGSDSATVTPLADFTNATTGSQPHGPLRLDAQGRILGLTRSGAANGKGGIFRFDPSTGVLEIVFAFPADLIGIANSLVLARDGNFYGTTSVLAQLGEIHRPLFPGSIQYYPTTDNQGNLTVNRVNQVVRGYLPTTDQLTLLHTVTPTPTPGSGGGILGGSGGTLGNLTLNGGTLTLNGGGTFTGNVSSGSNLVLGNSPALAAAAPAPAAAAASVRLNSATTVNGGTLKLNSATAQLSTTANNLTQSVIFTGVNVINTGSNNATVYYPNGPIFLGNAINLQVGSSVPQSGSIFRVSSTGEFTLLKVFEDTESVQTNIWDGPGFLAGTKTVLTAGDSRTLSTAEPPVTVVGPGVLLTAAERWQFTPDDSTLPVQNGTLSRVGAAYGKSAHAYFPCNLGETPAGDLLSWVSGGLYRQPADGSTGEWVLTPGTVGGYADPYILNSIQIYDSHVFAQEFGRVATIPTTTGLHIVLRDEAPAMETLPDGSLLIARDDREWQVTAAGYVDRTIAPSRTAQGEPLLLENHWGTSNLSFSYLTNHKLRGPIFPTGDARYRFEFTAPDAVCLTETGDGRARPLADLAELRCGALLPATAGSQDILVVGRSHALGATRALYRIARTANHPPVVPDTTLRTENGGVDISANPIVRKYLATPLQNAVDPNDDSFYVSAVSTPEHGTAEVLPANEIIYTAVEPSGPDTFTFTTTDLRGASTDARINIASSPPIAGDDRAEPIGTDTAGRLLYRVHPLLNDSTTAGLSLSAFVALNSDLGTVYTEGDAFVFTLAPFVHSVNYVVSNGERLALGHIYFSNSGPVAQSAYFLLNARQAVTIPISQIATDPDRDRLDVSVTVAPVHGEVGLRGNALFYQGDEDVISDEFTVSVSDGGGGSVSVVVHVSSTDSAFAGVFSGAMKNGSEVIGLLRLNATGRGKASLQWQIGKQIFRGVATLPASGSITTTLSGPRGKLLVTLTRTGATVTATTTYNGQTYDVTLTGSSPDPLEPAQYNVLLTGDETLVAHFGFAMIRQRADGTATITGRTPDGVAWSTSGIFDANGNLPVFALLKLGANSLRGTLQRGVIGEISGNLLWSVDDLVVTGLSADGDLYTPPLASNGNLFGDPSTSIGLTITTSGLPEVPSGFTVDARNRVTRQPGAVAGAQLLITPSTGLFRGLFRMNGHVTTFSGLFRGNVPVGAGPLNLRRGSVSISPAP